MLKWKRYSLLFLSLFVALETMVPKEAHAGRRCFGRRNIASRGFRGGFNRFGNFNNFGFRRNNFNAAFDFAGSPFFNPLNSSIIDSSLAAAQFSNSPFNSLQFDRFGNVFEVTGGAVLGSRGIRQPLFKRNGQIRGGAFFGDVLNPTLDDIRLFNFVNGQGF